MLRIKKLIAVLISLVLTFGLIPGVAFAADNSNDINGTLSEEKAILSSDDGTKYLVNLYETTTKLSTTNASNSLTANGVSDTSAYVREYQFILNPANMALVEVGNRPETLWDDTGSVSGTVTIYFYKDGSKYLITRATGSWSVQQSGTAIKDRQFQVVCMEGFDPSQTVYYSVSGSWDYTTNWTKYADSGAGLVGIGAAEKCTIYRTQAGTSWSFVVDNSIAGTISF
jgi:hypothetical protein